MTTTHPATPVTVVGAGVMGSAIARALLAGGHSVTVWNRTVSRAEPLRDAGAELADSLADGIRAGGVTVMCVANRAATTELLENPEVLEALRGQTLVQLTTGTPADGCRGAAFAEAHDIAYINGAIMAYPRTIGTDSAVILYSGAEAAFRAHEALLGDLGRAQYVGLDAGRPAVIDAALIAFFYGTLAGFLHGATLTRAEGIAIDQYLELARPFFATFISDAVQETGERIVARNYADAESSMRTHLGGIDLLVVGASREAEIDFAIMAAIRDSFARAITAGRGDEDIACLIEVATIETSDVAGKGST
jgi:3-hydroxyisobutyrate dehydrogenase-like beta-hydroxyacid dehydrogenase